MSMQFLAKRLREARESLDFTQKEVADRLKIARTAITQIEAGNRSVSTFEIAELARLYQKSVNFFLGETVEDEPSAVFLRAAPEIAKDPALKRNVARYFNLCKEGIALEKLLGVSAQAKELPSYTLQNPLHPIEAIQQGKNIATQERKRLSLGNQPIGDIAHLISGQGIWVSSTRLPTDMSGFFVNHPQTGLIILVNARHAIARKRFSYAHEYAHALVDRDGDNAFRISRTENKSEFIEMRANAFAAEFLMPEQGVADLLKHLNKGQHSRISQVVYSELYEENIVQTRTEPFSQHITYQDIAIMALHFVVSYRAMVHRLKNFNHYLTQKEYDELLSQQQEQLGRDYLKLLEPAINFDGEETEKQADKELRSQLLQLALEAYRREEISRGKLMDIAEMIPIDSRRLVKLIDV